MFEVILSPEAQAFYAGVDRPLARKLARCFAQLGRRVLASGPSIAEVATQLRLAQEDLQNAVLEHIEMDSTEINLGAAELL